MNWINNKFKLIQFVEFIIILVITCVALEIISRIFYMRLTTPASRLVSEVAYSDSFLGFDRTTKMPRFLPHPYMLYELAPNYEGDFKTNSLGYRNEEINLEKKGKLRILALGGSTTYGASVNNMNETWPALLEVLLKKNVSHKYEVINGGVDSAASAEILSTWIYKNRFLRPDIVILNLGINDIWPVLLTKDYRSDYLYFRQAKSFTRASKYSKILIRRSYLYRILWGYIFLNEHKENDAGYPYAQALDSDLKESELNNSSVTKRAVSTDNKGFRDNFEYLIKLLKLDHIKVVVVMEPSLDEESFINKYSNSNNFIAGIEKPWSIVKKKNEQIMMDVASKENVSWILLDEKLFENKFYSDWYHLKKEGELMKASLIEKFLIEKNIVN